METIQNALEEDIVYCAAAHCVKCEKWIGLEYSPKNMCTDCFKEYELRKKEDIKQLKLITS